MAWTNPRTWVTAEAVTAATLNTHVRDNLDFLYAPPRCYVYRSTNFNTTSGAWEKIEFGSEVSDTDSMHLNGTDPSRVNANTAGQYLVVVTVEFDAHATGRRQIMLRKNAGGNSANGNTLGAVNYATVATGNAGIQYTRVANLNVGDYVEAFVYQTSTTTLAVVGGQDNTYMQVHYLGN